MKTFNVYWMVMVAITSFVIGGISADLGKTNPSYVVNGWMIITAISVFVGMFVLGYIAAKKDSEWKI